MAKPRILHMFATSDNVSPFDVNMAGDAGYEVIVPYRGTNADNVSGLIQDAIFSRSPGSFNSTGAFIGGYDINLAADMLDKAKKAMVPPFEISVFADPNGAYTTSAALVALAEHHLQKRTGKGFQGLNVLIFGGGPVGLCAAVLIAQQGGSSTLVRLTPPAPAKQEAVARFTQRYNVELPNVDGQTDEQKTGLLKTAQVAITTAKAGIQVLSKELLDQAPELLVAADVNAVPPTGIAGVEPMHNGVELTTAAGTTASIGALAIGKIKYDVQHGLFKQMLATEQALCLDFPDAYQLATRLV